MKKIINYSGIPALVLMATLVFMPFSCSKEAVKENPLTDNSSQLIKISGEDANAVTKTILVDSATLWLGGIDQVGVYCHEAQGENGWGNIPYTASRTAFSSAFTGSLTWGTETHNFYAYYPYNSSYSESWGSESWDSEPWGVVPISLDAEQFQYAGNSNDHLSALDFMVATPKTVVTPGTTGNPTTVNLHYNHVFTILEFQITGTGTLSAVSLTVPTTDPPSPPIAFSGYTIDITQGTPASGDAYIINVKPPDEGGSESNEVIVWLDNNPPTLSTTTATTVYMVINPGIQTGDCLIGLDIDLGGSTTTYYISKAAPEITSDPLVKGFSRGKKYVVPIDAPVVTDVDNNVYNTITIGTQVWMAENLKTTSYNDGTPIPTVTDGNSNVSTNDEWAGLGTGAYCWYNTGTEESPGYDDTYGALYNWYAVDNNSATKEASNGGKNICPVGWHVPTDVDWNTLTTYLVANLGVSTNVAKALAATTNWSTSATAGDVGNDLTINNSSGFTALPGGYRLSTGSFGDIGNYGLWWSSAVYDTSAAWDRGMSYNTSDVRKDYNGKTFGFSVRCVRGD